jgi:hypothetical protein
VQRRILPVFASFLGRSGMQPRRSSPWRGKETNTTVETRRRRERRGERREGKRGTGHSGGREHTSRPKWTWTKPRQLAGTPTRVGDEPKRPGWSRTGGCGHRGPWANQERQWGWGRVPEGGSLSPVVACPAGYLARHPTACAGQGSGALMRLAMPWGEAGLGHFLRGHRRKQKLATMREPANQHSRILGILCLPRQV